MPLLIVAEQGREWGWSSAGVLGLIALGIVGVIAFIMIEIRMKDEALIPMRLFHSRVFSIGLTRERAGRSRHVRCAEHAAAVPAAGQGRDARPSPACC